MSSLLTEEKFTFVRSPVALPRARFDTIEANPCSVATWLERLSLDVKRRRRNLQGVKLSTSLNGATVVRARNDTKFRAIMATFDYIDLDGMSMVYWSRLLRGASAPERVATTDFIHYAARAAAATGISFFLLGGTEKSNRAAAARLRSLYPGLVIAGRRNGYFDLEESDEIVNEINCSKADIVWVGLGVPREQAFIVANRERFTHAAWIKSCGGCFDFLSGKVVRAPGWMQQLGLEWSFRLAQEPRRLFWRYAFTNPQALMLMFRQMWTDWRQYSTSADWLRDQRGNSADTAGVSQADAQQVACGARGLASVDGEQAVAGRARERGGQLTLSAARLKKKQGRPEHSENSQGTGS